MSRSHLPILFGAVALGALVTFLYLSRLPDEASSPTADLSKAEPPAASTGPAGDPVEPADTTDPVLTENEVDTPASPMDALENAGLGVRKHNPQELMEELRRAFESGDLAEVGRVTGADALSPETRKLLVELMAHGAPAFAEGTPVSEIGELEINRRARWSLNLKGAEPGSDRVYIDLVRDDDGWSVGSVVVPAKDPAANAPQNDSLGMADAFLQATFRQQFQEAKRFVDTDKVSDAKIAGLCILFEEGNYRMRPQKPLRAMFQRETEAGYLAHVLAGESNDHAQFSMTLSNREGRWLVTEVNLDQLLADYAQRVAGGDVHYTPLLKNPTGGDTLVLYFEFDADGLTPRTSRQLEIVADLLRLDAGKKLTISGHTDALGTENYNEKLSDRRAVSVRDYLIGLGVGAEQIQTVAEGQTQPRRPNFTDTGEDNPSGRRANRRTEIYLDF